MLDLCFPIFAWVGATVAGTVAAYAAVASVVTAGVGTYMSYAASVQQAKQTKMNADAQASAIGMEQQRQQLETQQAQQRKITEQRRFTAMQEAGMADTGFLATTGSPLDILADTHTAQQRELNDMGYQNDTNSGQLGAQARAEVGSAYSQANAIKAQAGGTLLSNAGSTAMSAYQAYGQSLERKTAPDSRPTTQRTRTA